MKKISVILFVFFSILSYSQTYSSLLKNARWTIMKINWSGTDYYPPIPFTTSGKVIFNNNGIQSKFFNTAAGNIVFGDNNANYFSVVGISVSLAEYNGENEQLVQEFDSMTTEFYHEYQPADKFYFEYQELFSGKNLIVTNPLGHKIFYSNMLLGNSETFLDKEISISPNPAKNEFFLKSARNSNVEVIVEIYDISGKLHLTQRIFSSDPVSTKNLQDGVYFVKILDSGVKFSSKLIIKK
jgi:hypothetical protein